MITAIRPPCDGGVVRSGGPARKCPLTTANWVLAATILSSSMVFIDGSVVNLALPSLQASLHANASDLQWVVEIYTLSLASLVLVGGALGDQFGRRRVFSAGIFLFAVASVVCGLAHTPGQLISGRALQGLGGAMLVPGSLALIGAFFEGAERARAFGTWSGATAITSAAGPVLGGWLIASFSWHAVFFVNIPLALVTLWIAQRRVPESHAELTGAPLDGWGAALATFGLLAGTYGLIVSQSAGLGSLPSLAGLGVGGVMLGTFLMVESRAPAPMIPLALFRSRTFSGANLLTLLLYAAVGGALFFLPFDLIQVQGYSTTHAGWALVPVILMLFLLARSSEGLQTRFGIKRLLTVGPLVAAVGLGLLSVPGIGGSYWSTFFPGLITLGLGMGLTVVPLTTAVMTSVPTTRSGVASGINNAVSRTAGLLAIAAFGVVLVGCYNRTLDSLVKPLSLTAETQAELRVERLKLADARAPQALSADQRARLQQAIAESYVEGFRLVMRLAAALAVAASLAAATLIEDSREVPPG